MTSIFTIGHSNHTADKFLQLLRAHQISAVCDVRSSPRSRLNPQFDRDNLRANLRENGIQYVFLGNELGARPKNKAYYENGRALYSLISQSPEFSNGIERLKNGAESYRLALLCAEQDPITCHRAILVCRHLSEYDIGHILPNGILESHSDAMRRLIRALGVKGSIDEDNHAIIDAAYDVQGKNICYTESIQRNSDPADRMERFL